MAFLFFIFPTKNNKNEREKKESLDYTTYRCRSKNCKRMSMPKKRRAYNYCGELNERSSDDNSFSHSYIYSETKLFRRRLMRLLEINWKRKKKKTVSIAKTLGNKAANVIYRTICIMIILKCIYRSLFLLQVEKLNST